MNPCLPKWLQLGGLCVTSSFLIFIWSFSPFSGMAQTNAVKIGNGNYEGINVTSSGTNDKNAYKTLDGIGLLPNLSAASRFLAQSTLGADYETITKVSEMSFSEWIDAQFATARPFGVEAFTRELTVIALDSIYSMGGDPQKVKPHLYYWNTAWWQYIMTGEDLLRSKVALALSEIFVISEVSSLKNYPLTLANYYDVLLDHSFGNYRELLEKITLHPAMGVYLTHINNPKADERFNRFPDENYAREVMQLFSIGLNELNNDGTIKRDANGDPIPTYDNDDIEEFAKVFTGLTWGDAFLFGQKAMSRISYTVPMVMINAWHEPGPKQLLNGVNIPDRRPVNGLADIKDALDNLFNHPNVGPFLAKRLIQRMVKSNPSPDYINRVANAFNDNGSGTRGDLKAVIKAILLDPEARDCGFINDPFEGMLREPITRYTHLSRAFNAGNEEGLYRNTMKQFHELLGQKPLASPSVFNFFQPDYQPVGPIEEAGLVAPEFQITNSVTILGYANRLHDWIMKKNNLMEFFKIYGKEGWHKEKTRINLDLSDEMDLGDGKDVDALLERINLILLHGQMTEPTRNIIRKAIVEIPDKQKDIRVRMAIYLAMISPDYLILR